MSKKYRDFDSITFSQIRNGVRSGRAQFIAIDQRGVVKGDVFIKVLLAMCTGSGHLHDTHKVSTILSSCRTMCSILLRSFSALSRVCAIGKLKLKYLNVLSKFNKSVVFSLVSDYIPPRCFCTLCQNLVGYILRCFLVGCFPPNSIAIPLRFPPNLLFKALEAPPESAGPLSGCS